MPPKKGHRQRRGLVRRQQIGEAAFELFAGQGYRTTSLADIAERVGITEAGLFHHFRTKESLLLAALQYRDSAYTDVEAWVAEPMGGVETLRRIPAMAGVLVDRPLIARFHIIVGAESIAFGGPAREYFVARAQAIRRALADMLTEGIRRGEFCPDTDVFAKASEMLAFMEGIQVHWFLDPAAVDLVGAYTSYVSSLEAELALPMASSRGQPRR